MSVQSDATALVITDARSLRWASVRTEGVVIADHERKRAYAVIGNPIVGLEARGKWGRNQYRLPATGKDRIVGIANEGLLAMVPFRHTVSDADVHATIAPVLLARHDTEVSGEADYEREQVRRMLGVIAAGISMAIVAFALLVIVIATFGDAIGLDASRIGELGGTLVDTYTPSE